MQLSTRRANAIVKYIDLEMPDFPYKQQLLFKLTAVGRGENDANRFHAMASDRKVVFRFEFRNEILPPKELEAVSNKANAVKHNEN